MIRVTMKNKKEDTFEPIPYCDTCGEPLDDDDLIEKGFCDSCLEIEERYLEREHYAWFDIPVNKE